MRNPFGVVVLLAPLFFFGCASNGPLPIPGLKESFHTEIAANGAKRFTYSLKMQRRNFPAPFTDSGRGRNAMPRGGMRGGGPRGDGLQFDRALEQILAETRFCREGYFVLERTVSAFSGEVRGECREGAR